MRLDDFLLDDVQRMDEGALYDAFDWVRAMARTPQDPQYHGEGDVWTHTKMVCAALADDEEWRGLERPERRLMLTAALLHDAGKPDVTYTDDDGRIRSPHHSARGETIARQVLWRLEEPLEFREHVAALVRHHMQPRYLPEQRDPRRRTWAISWAARCDLLALLARADTRGRIASDFEHALSRIAQFRAFCERHDCLRAPRPFTSDHARFLFFQRRLDDADALVAPPGGPTIHVMAGLPGSGKDTWVARHAGPLPVVALDDIRAELGVRPTDPQERVLELAHHRARQLLAEGQDFIWNATTLGRKHRRTLIELALPWDPVLRIIHVDAPPSLLFPRNRARAGVAAVPEDVIWRMTHIWQPPDPTEAHEVVHVSHFPTSGAEYRVDRRATAGVQA